MSLENAILVAFGVHEALEQGILDALRREGRPFVALDLERRRLHRSDRPGWIGLCFAPGKDSAYLVRRELLAALDDCAPRQLLCVGLDAAWLMNRVLPEVAERDVILAKDDVGFAKTRGGKLAKIAELMGNHRRVFCLDEYQFAMLADKGSCVPHFLFDVDPRGAGGAGVALDPAAKTIGLIRGPKVGDAQCRAIMTMIRRSLPDCHVRVISKQDLFTPADATALRPLCDAMQSKLEGVGGLVVLGYGRNVQVLLRALAPVARHRTVVADNFHLRNTLWDIASHFALAPTYGLAERLAKGLETHAGPCVDGSAPSVSEQLRRAAGLDVPDCYEDLRALRQDGPIDIFFSVTPVETHSRGARAKRIRNMLLALREGGPVVELNGSPDLLERRIRLLEAEAARGRRFRIFYGENSTSPVPSLRSLARIGDLVGLVRSQGGKAGWFIRDLHFMSQEVWSADNGEDLSRRARMEFSFLSEQVDVFYAPSEASGQMFRKSLPAPARAEVRWGVLPPAMGTPASTPVRAGSPVRLCFLYTGGLGPIYAMDKYLDAVRSLYGEPDVQFDFVVREEERHHLDGIAGLGDGVRIRTEEFDHYVSDAEQLIGVSLLESGYGDAAFPVKVMDYLSRGIPVLFYENASYADFLNAYGAGWMVKRSPGRVEAALRDVIGRARAGQPLLDPDKLERVRRENCWQQRASQVRSDLCP